MRQPEGYLARMDGVRVLPDRRPMLSLWIGGLLVNIYEGERETDVYLIDANTPETEKPSLVTLVLGQPAAASPAT